jgi:hypothetical protein
MSHTTKVISIGQLNVAAGGYSATLDRSFRQPESTVSRVARDTDAPIVTNVALGLHALYLEVLVLSAGVPADDVDARRRALLRELDTTRGPVTLVVENATGTPRTRYMQCIVRAIDPREGQGGVGFTVALEAYDQVRWQSTSETIETWTMSESGTHTVTVAGDLDVYPVYTLTPVDGKTAPNWPYQRRVFVEWRSPYGGAHPIDVTGGGLDTNTLLANGQINDETNIAVMMNGRIHRHWTPGGNTTYPDAFGTTQTRIWINMEFQPAVYPVLAQYVSATATAWPVWDDEGLPPSGTLQVGAEIVTYASRAPGFLYGVKRGRWGTAAEAHNGFSNITHYQGVGWILYGPTAVTPEGMKDSAYHAAQPPMFLNYGSSNAVWFYDEFAAPGRAGSWVFNSFLNNIGYVTKSSTTGTFDSTWTYPWQALGLKAGWTSLSVFALRLAVPVKSLRVQGRRVVRGSPLTSPNSPLLSALSDDQQQRRPIWRATEGATTTPAWFDEASGDIRPAAFDPNPADYNRLWWAVNHANHLQADIQQMWITLDDNYTPIVTVGAQQTDYDLDVTLTNQTTGESLAVQFPNLVEGESLVIDSQWQTVTYTLDGSNQYHAVQRDAARPKFLRLAPGANELQVTETGMGELEISVAYRARWYA